MKIEKFVKKSSGMYKLFLDNDVVIELHEDLILKEDLLLKREINGEDIVVLLEKNRDYLAYSMALKYLGVKMRSIKEVKNYLAKKDVSSSTIDDVISRLIREGYLNDSVYASSYVNDRIALSNDGPLKVRKSLEELGVDSDSISNALVVFNDEVELEKIKKLVLKQIKTNSNKGEYLLKQKIFYNLSNLGYSKSLIQSVLDDVSFNDSSLREKEYNKLYNKLSKKYSGRELEYRIKQGLYQKGFRT